MSVHDFLNLLNELGKIYTMRGLTSILSFLPTILINRGSYMSAHVLLN